MSFGNTDERSIDELSQKIDDLNNQRKLADLDLEKRMLVLESNVKSVRKLLGNIKDFEATKDALLQIDEIQKSLRDIEDTSLIERLEGVQSDERLALLEERAKDMKSKIALLSDAIDILGESKATVPAQASAAPDEKVMLALRSEMESMKGAMSKLAASIVPPQKISEIEASVARNQESVASLINEFKVLAETVRERIDRMDRRLEQQKNIEVPEYLMRDIRAIHAEMQQLRSVNSQIVKQVELGANKIVELKSRNEGRTDYSGFENGLEDLRKNFMLLRKEMDLDRAMYPENFTKIQREIAALKGAKGSGASSADVKAMAADLVIFAGELKKIKEQLPKYDEKMASMLQGNTQKSSDIAELKKNVGPLQKKIDDLHGEITAVSEMKKQLAAGKDQLIRQVNEVSEKVKRFEELQKSARHSGAGNLADDISTIHGELEEMKKLLMKHHDAIDALMKRPAPAGSEAAGGADIDALARIQGQIDNTKAMEEEIVNLVEANTKKIQEMKPAENIGKDYASLKKGLEELGRTVIALNQEIEDKIAHYPENMDQLKKEIQSLKNSRATPASSEAPAKVARDIDALRKDLDMSKKAIADITNMFEGLAAASRQGIKSRGDVDKAFEEMIFFRKDLDSSKKAIAELSDMLRKMPAAIQSENSRGSGKVEAELAALRKDIDTSHDAIAELAGMLDKAVSGAGKQANGGALQEKASQEIALLRKELDVSKKSILDLSEMFRRAAAAPSKDTRTNAALDEMENEMNSLRADIGKSNSVIAELAEVVQKSVRNSEAAGKVASENGAAMPALKNAPEIAALNARIRNLEEELLEFKSVAKSLIDENGRLAESLKETSYEISDIRQKQPIIID